MVTTCSGAPVNLALRSSCWVAMPDGAGVEVALPDHLAAQRQQRERAEAEPLGAEQGGDHHVTTGPETAVGLQGDPGAEAVGHQHLVGLGQPELPWRPGVLDRDAAAMPRCHPRPPK